jgi:hypothetical protein
MPNAPAETGNADSRREVLHGTGVEALKIVQQLHNSHDATVASGSAARTGSFRTGPFCEEMPLFINISCPVYDNRHSRSASTS